MVAERTGPHSPVTLSGSVPPLAEFFHQRPETGLDLRVGLYPGDTVVLTHGAETASAPAGQGGTGKTQIAVAFSHALWGARAVDALVWVPATSREAIVTGFAQAARTVGAADHALPAEAAAGRFTRWLAHTRRPWALILDDLVSLADLEGLWPAGQGGQVVITTGLPEAAFQGGPRIAPVGGFSRREVLAYLSARLTDFPDQRAEALDLGADLDGLPLALAQAAAVMSLNRLSCREYRAGSASGASTWPRSWWTASPPPCWPPGRWRRSARTSCRPRAWPGRPSRWPPCSTRTASPARC